MSLTIAATGHRPKSLPTGYDLDPLIALATGYLSSVRPDTVISGVALGWDSAVAIAAQRLGIPVHAYIPHIGQADKWPHEAVCRYTKILEGCEKKIIVSPGGYSPEKMQIRNIAMVDVADTILALWSGEPGGTANCVRYAEKVGGKEIVNLWSVLTMEV